MPQDRKFYKGQFGDDTIQLVRELVHISPIETKGRFYNWYIAPHVHNNLFQVFIIETGSLHLLYNDERYFVEAPAFFTVPVNVSHGLELEPGMSGWVISLADTAVENMLKLDADIIFEIDEVHIAKVNTADERVAEAYSTMHKCISEYRNDLPAKHFALQYLVGMMFIRLYRIPASSKEVIRFSDNTNKIHFRRFGQLVREPNSGKKSVEDYAKALAISTGHLNRICRSVAGKSPKDVILDFVIDQAKLALSNSELSIAEVCYQLHFEDPGYFARLFKKKTGSTPKDFRKQLGLH